jgi:steroid 5-alpha reductase family enzyme
MQRSLGILICSLLLIPLSVVFFDVPLSIGQRDILNTLLIIYLSVSSGCFVISELSRNYSQVDKLWSIIPVVYAFYVAYTSGFDERITLMALLVALWGLRLTFNFARKGGYSFIPWQGEEDYRWAVLRKQALLKSRWAWTAFNLFFISFYQQGLILLFTLPVLVAVEGSGSPLSWIDYLAAALILGLLVIETIADQQQYNFQSEKYRRIKSGEPLGEYNNGFVRTGLWSLSRHPNFAAEQLIWVVFYFFSVAATGRILNWSIAGCLMLMLLFYGSSDFTEKISAGKYPEYSDYRKRVKRFLPF